MSPQLLQFFFLSLSITCGANCFPCMLWFNANLINNFTGRAEWILIDYISHFWEATICAGEAVRASGRRSKRRRKRRRRKIVFVKQRMWGWVWEEQIRQMQTVALWWAELPVLMIKNRPPLSANKPLSVRHAYRADRSLRHGPDAKNSRYSALNQQKSSGKMLEEEDGASLLLPPLMFLFKSLRNDNMISVEQPITPR